MSETTTVKPTKIEFIQYHQPALKDGDYKITLKQEVTGKKNELNTSFTDSFTIAKTFTVSGERFDLKPKDIHAVFPPAGSLGEHSNVLPHIILNRSTLPWERQADANNKNLPWLALLLFEEEEKPEPQVITLKDLSNIQSYPAKFPDFVQESGQHKDDKLTVIDVQKLLLDKILSTKKDLEYLAHVRQATDNDGNLVGDELAVIIGNRLPKKGTISTVHLVSIEGRYNDNGFNYQDAGDNDYIRFVSLKSWRFACVDKKQSFKGLLTHINREPSTLRLPNVNNAEADKYLSMGYLPLPHFLRQGGKTFSWYHSPLITGNNPTDNITLPIRAADELVRYNPNNGMFDISYAAAWELGRLLALQSKHFSISLYYWKRSHKQALKCIEAAIDSHLPFHDPPNVELPSDIASWFTNLSFLKGVPFNYLVPDEQLLPTESIRFFCVDSVWIECLLDGAFSIGRVSEAEYQYDRERSDQVSKNPHPNVSGFLLRSDVVAGWPGLLVDGYDEVVENNNFIPDKEKLSLLRMDRLSANVLICLFKGEVKTVDIHQKPETMHFGLDFPDDRHPNFHKELKDREGRPNNLQIQDIPWKDETKRAIDIDRLADKIKDLVGNGNTFTSAQFALEAIEGVQKVRFVMRDN